MSKSLLDFLELEDIPEGSKDVAEIIGLETFKELVQYFGGTTIYIPKYDCITRNARNRVIERTFKGDFNRTAKEYRLSTGHVRRILKK